MAISKVSLTDRDRFARARSRGRSRAQDASAAIGARYDADRGAIVLAFRGGGSMLIPREVVPGLAGASGASLRSMAISPAGDALSWPALGIDVYVPGLVE